MTDSSECRGGRPWRFILVVLLVAVAAGAAIYVVWRGKPKPSDILAKAVQTYAKASSLRGEGTLSMSLGGTAQTAPEWQFDFAYKRPARSRIVFSSGGEDEVIVVASGKYVYTYFPPTNTGRRDAAPEGLIPPMAALLAQTEFADLKLPLSTGQLLLGDADIQGVESAELVETETVDGQDRYSLHLTYPSGLEQDVSIGKKDSLLWKVVTQGTLSDTLEASGLAADDPTVQAAREQGLELHITEKLTKIELDPELGPDVFSFKPPPDALIERDLTGEEAPDFVVHDLAGNTVRLSEFRGKPVIVDFWATWCAPCLQVMPILDEIYREYADQGLAVLGLDTTEGEERIKAFVHQLNVSFPILWAPEGDGARIARAYGVRGIPRTLVIDAEGIVRADFTGAHEKDDYVQALSKVGIR